MEGSGNFIILTIVGMDYRNVRPEILFPLHAATTSLPGIGPKLAQVLARLTGGERVIDLLWHLPRDIIDRRYSPALADAEAGRIATIEVEIGNHAKPARRSLPYRITCTDGSGLIDLVFFNGDERYLTRTFPTGTRRVISGRLELFRGRFQMIHPDFVVTADKRGEIPDVEAVYPGTQGLSSKQIAKAVDAAIDRIPVLPEWLDPELKKRRAWPSWSDALKGLHAPKGRQDLDYMGPARMRLAFDELLANQLALAIMRRRYRSVAGREIRGDRHLAKAALEALPFPLTDAQIEALKEITADMASPRRMLRLLQGDVGSGKTLVAFFTMLVAIEAGGQTALMAPTEILARQHLDTLAPLAAKIGVTVEILTGREKGKTRKEILERLASGRIDILVGTHALFQDDVVYRDLMLAVVDEQHRFGVHQRLNLAKKGKGVDMLVMTATPIPRTLTMTAYGDLDVSRLMTKPAGRKPIKTVVISNERMVEVIEGIGRQLKEGAQVYWVCPLVSESEALDLAAAEERAAALTERFGKETVALVHGQMPGKAKDEAMERFVSGSARILVATTVIEVGVNVPNATVMVIEHAERFGLAQLHQLRGRIGRGEKASTCILLRAQQIGETARERLRTMAETEDGFVIAEKDLELRGAGEILGTKQSGLPEFRIADFAVHADLMRMAYEDAELVLTRDEHLEGGRGRSLRILLYLFERDAAIENLRSG